MGALAGGGCRGRRRPGGLLRRLLLLLPLPSVPFSGVWKGLEERVERQEVRYLLLGTELAARASHNEGEGRGPVLGRRPFLFLPLFTGVRGRGILRSSPYRISRKFCSAPAPCGRASYVEYRRLLIRRT